MGIRTGVTCGYSRHIGLMRFLSGRFSASLTTPSLNSAVKDLRRLVGEAEDDERDETEEMSFRWTTGSAPTPRRGSNAPIDSFSWTGLARLAAEETLQGGVRTEAAWISGRYVSPVIGERASSRGESAQSP